MERSLSTVIIRAVSAALVFPVVFGLAGCTSAGPAPSSMGARTVPSSAGSPAGSSAPTSTSTTTPTTQRLDGAGETWFDTFCTGLTGLRTTMQAVGTPTGFDVSTPVAYQAGLAQVYYGAADAFATFGSTLAATAAPSFDGGAAFARDISATLTGTGAQLRAQVDAFAATPVVDLASVEAANQTLAVAVQAGVSQLGTELAAVTGLPPEIRSDVLDLPSCAILAP